MGKHSKLRKNLSELARLNRALSIDIHLALVGLGRSYRQYVPDSDIDSKPVFEVGYWNRIAIRAFLAQVEGLSHVMRRFIGQPSNSRQLGLTNKKRAEVLERRYDKELDQVTRVLSPNKVADNIKLAFRYYPRLFGTEFALDTNSPSWKALIKILIPARNNMTHAGTFEDFFSLESAQTLQPCLVWFLSSIGQMFGACAAQIDTSISEADYQPERLRSVLSEYQFDESKFQRLPMSRDDFLDEVSKYQGRSLVVLRRSASLLGKENSRALDEFKSAEKSMGLAATSTQFALRNVFRVFVTYVEGMVYVLRLYIEQAHERGEITLTEGDEKSLKYIDIFDRAVSTSDIFAARFGHGGAFESTEAHWNAVKLALKYRHSLTHPKSIRDLEFKRPKILGTVANCIGWQVDLLRMIELDTDELVRQGKASGSIIPSRAC